MGLGCLLRQENSKVTHLPNASKNIVNGRAHNLLKGELRHEGD